MDIKVNQLQQVKAAEEVKDTQNVSGEDFKFALMSNIGEKDLQERLTLMMNEITMQGEKIKKRKNITDMRKYRSLIKGFMNEVINRSHKFSRENFLDRRGRHRVYGIIRKVDENLDKLAEELMKEEKDNIVVLGLIGEIRGMLIDLLM
ncbi:MAG: YaaR family protein [Lachnospiraceae bacterium]|nr:YaaR family protein [Lachnospiraceae bacterium]MDN4744686.1 YaaR family protein [Lachnospiraceae bacterium C1.1]